MRTYVAVLLALIGLVLLLAGINGSAQQLFASVFGSGAGDKSIDPLNPKNLTPNAQNKIGINGGGPANGSSPPGTKLTPIGPGGAPHADYAFTYPNIPGLAA